MSSFCCVGRGLAIGQSPVQGVPLKCLNGVTFSEVNSDSEKAIGPNPQNLEQIKETMKYLVVAAMYIK
jgi:hypothetical protein